MNTFFIVTLFHLFNLYNKEFIHAHNSNNKVAFYDTHNLATPTIAAKLSKRRIHKHKMP